MNEIGTRITSTPINTGSASLAAKPKADTTSAQPQDKVSLGNNNGNSIGDKAAEVVGKTIKLVAGVIFGALNVIPHAMGGAMVGPEMATGFDYCCMEREPETGYLATANIAHLVQGASLGAVVGGIPGAIIGGIIEFGYALLTVNEGCGPAAEVAHDVSRKVDREMEGKSYRKSVGGEIEGTVRGAFHGAVDGFTMFLGNKD